MEGTDYKMDQDTRDRTVAALIKAGKCPFGMLEEGEPMATCPLGFPGCGCADELMLNPYLQDIEDVDTKSND